MPAFNSVSRRWLPTWVALPALVLALAALSARAAPAQPPPLSEETIVVPWDGAVSVPTNARLFVEPRTSFSLSVDGGPLSEPSWPESDPHPGFDGAVIDGLLPSTSQVIELDGEEEGERLVIHVETADGEDTTPPALEGEVEIQQRTTLFGYDIVAIVPASFDDFSVARIGIFSSGAGMGSPTLFQSITGPDATNSHELSVPAVPAGEQLGIQVVVVDGAGNETATDIMDVTAGEGAGCSSAGPFNSPAPLLGLGLLLLPRRRSRS